MWQIRQLSRFWAFFLFTAYDTVFAQLLEVDAGVYSRALSGGRNNCTMREEISTAQTDA